MAGKAEYKNQWQKENCDRVNLTLPKGQKEELQAHVANRNESVNGFIARAISETLERDGVNSPQKIIYDPDFVNYTLSQKEMVAISPQNCCNNIINDLRVLNIMGQRKAERAVEKIVERSGYSEDKQAFLGKALQLLFKKLNLDGRKKLLECAVELSNLQRYLLKEDSPPARILAMLELLEIDRQYKAVDEISKLKGEDKYRVSSTEQKSEVEKAPESEPLHDDHVEE